MRFQTIINKKAIAATLAPLAIAVPVATLAGTVGTAAADTIPFQSGAITNGAGQTVTINPVQHNAGNGSVTVSGTPTNLGTINVTPVPPKVIYVPQSPDGSYRISGVENGVTYVTVPPPPPPPTNTTWLGSMWGNAVTN